MGSTQKDFVHVQKISPLQMEERRKNGLCYNYDSKWSPGHWCVVPKLFIIEIVEILDNEIPVDSLLAMECPKADLMELCYNEANPKISLHAITGSNHPKTTRIIGRIGNQKIVILIDSGSTHKFLDSAIVKKVQLLVNNDSIIRV
jgi:hypothetical protein